MFYDYLRLGIACLMVFGGLALLFRPGAQIFMGVLLGGVGLAVALQETDLLVAHFLRGKQ